MLGRAFAVAKVPLEHDLFRNRSAFPPFWWTRIQDLYSTLTFASASTLETCLLDRRSTMFPTTIPGHLDVLEKRNSMFLLNINLDWMAQVSRENESPLLFTLALTPYPWACPKPPTSSCQLQRKLKWKCPEVRKRHLHPILTQHHSICRLER